MIVDHFQANLAISRGSFLCKKKIDVQQTNEF